MEIGVGVIQRNRAADQFERRFGAPGLVNDQPKQVQTIRAVGIVGEEPAIEPFRLGEPSCLVLSCRFRQQRRPDSCGVRLACAGSALFRRRAALFAVHDPVCCRGVASA